MVSAIIKKKYLLLRNLQDQEVGLLTEITHLQEIMDGLCLQADSPESLPTSSEQVIMDLKGLDTKAWSIQV